MSLAEPSEPLNGLYLRIHKYACNYGNGLKRKDDPCFFVLINGRLCRVRVLADAIPLLLCHAQGNCSWDVNVVNMLWCAVPWHNA